ncbi:Uncharacterised protein [Bordetella pertussis]|nr:Uncharacterised protein [Bordetella pertussis]
MLFGVDLGTLGFRLRRAQLGEQFLVLGAQRLGSLSGHLFQQGLHFGVITVKRHGVVLWTVAGLSPKSKSPTGSASRA